MVKVCVRCGEEFAIPRNHRIVIYCDKCRKEITREKKRVQRVCELCKKKFVGHPLSKYCDKCRKEVKRLRDQERRSHEKLPKKPKTVKTLDEWAREARECGLDYGNYRALIASGRTFEQLKAQPGYPQLHSHCRRWFER